MSFDIFSEEKFSEDKITTEKSCAIFLSKCSGGGVLSQNLLNQINLNIKILNSIFENFLNKLKCQKIKFIL